MANPAELLHKQLSTWASQNIQSASRGLKTEAGWVAQRQAARNLDHLDDLLNEMNQSGKDVVTERQYFSSWTRAVFAYPRGWNDSSNGLIDPGSLNILRIASHRLADIVLPVTDDATTDMIAAADELEADLKMRTDIPPALQMLVAESIGLLRNAVLEYDVTGEFILNKAVKKFAQILELLEETFPGDPVASNLKYRVRRWYKAPPVQMALAGLISAQMALAAPPANDAIAGVTREAIEVVTSAFDLPAGESSDDITGPEQAPDTLEVPDQ